MKPYSVDHKKWHRFLPETQLQNIAAELSRASSAGLYENAEKKEQEKGAYERALALIDASIADPQWKEKRRLYELRDAIAALYAGHGDPALSRFICSELIQKTAM